MKGNLASLMQQAQKMQEQMAKAQEELARLEVTGESAGGMVKVVMSGTYAVRRLHIDPSLLEDAELLEDVVAAAVNDAVNRVNASKQEKLSGLTMGLPLPPGLKLPF